MHKTLWYSSCLPSRGCRGSSRISVQFSSVQFSSVQFSPVQSSTGWRCTSSIYWCILISRILINAATTAPTFPTSLIFLPDPPLQQQSPAIELSFSSLLSFLSNLSPQSAISNQQSAISHSNEVPDTTAAMLESIYKCVCTSSY